MTQIIDPKQYTKTVDALRLFFSSRGFLEVHTQNRLSILAACEDPQTIATYDYEGDIWPLPQTGQMWLEYELLKNPEWPGVFCVSTSFRNEMIFSLCRISNFFCHTSRYKFIFSINNNGIFWYL